MRRYAQDTTVSSDRSRGEIEKVLRNYGASSFAYGWEGSQAVIGFKAHGRSIRFNLPLPDRQNAKFTKTPGRGWERDDRDAERLWEQACRASWRALLLVIKAKLEGVAAGITTFEAEFLAATLLPGNITVEEATRTRIEAAYQTGAFVSLLPGLPAGDAK